ncbi:PTS sugar transporter subunit IIA [Brevibacillus sp. SYP-B805]|uniref:PTS sugar transporter subunit IIA n=1 Tax=Brevibacillus sp. SYP-B805 TaxID=1578199 RepID=UPI0013EBD575|nr:PTS sugar transporter subunit IIA [Brevibacillus sp. SYP-B805]
MDLSEYIHKEHIRIFDGTVEQSDLLHQLGDVLIQTGAVTSAYIEAVCERERTFPTGLLLEEINVAIPHADPHHVIKPAIAMGVVKESVPFGNMADPQMSIPVQVVFLLAPDKSERQLVLLEQVMALIQDQGQMKRIMEAQEAEGVLRVLRRKA